LEISRRIEGEVVFIKVVGRLVTNDERAKLKAEIDSCVTRKQYFVAVNTKNIEWMNSTSLAMLLKANAELKNLGGALGLVMETERYRYVFSDVPWILRKQGMMFDDEHEVLEMFKERIRKRHK